MPRIIPTGLPAPVPGLRETVTVADNAAVTDAGPIPCVTTARKEYPAGAFAGMSKVKVWMTSPLSAAKLAAFSVTVTITPSRTKVRRAFCTAGKGKSDITCR